MNAIDREESPNPNMEFSGFGTKKCPAYALVRVLEGNQEEVGGYIGYDEKPQRPWDISELKLPSDILPRFALHRHYVPEHRQ